MAAVATTWVVVTAVCVGIGALLLRATGARITTPDRVLVAVVLGLAACLAFLQIWHFWQPISLASGCVVALAGVAGLLLARHDVIPTIRRCLQHRGIVVASVLLLVWLSNHAIAPGDAVDSGAYQYAAIRWATAYPVVPGLANLDAMLGVTNANLLLHAMLDAPGSPWHGRVEHVGNGLFLLPLVGLVVLSLTRACRAWATRTLSALPASDALGVALAVPALMLSLSRELSSPRTDLPTMVFAAFVVSRLLALLTTANQRDRRVDMFIVCAFAATLPTLKLSMAALGLSAWIVGVLAWLRLTAPPTRDALRGVLVAAALSATIVGPSVTRTFVASGYPLFPAAIGAVNIDWQIPDAARLAIEDEVRVWPRVTQPQLAATTLHGRVPPWVLALLTPDGSLTGVRWLGPWFLSSLVLWPIEFAGPLLLMGFALWPRRGTTRPFAHLWLAAIPPLMSVLFWLVVAPLPRYGYAGLWAAAATVCAIRWKAGTEGRRRLIGAVLLSTLVVATVAHRALANIYLYKVPAWQGVFWVEAGPDRGFHPRPPTRIEPIVNPAGLTIWAPPGLDLLWDAPLLSTLRRGSIDGLRLRDPQDLSQGFWSETR